MGTSGTAQFRHSYGFGWKTASMRFHTSGGTGLGTTCPSATVGRDQGSPSAIFFSRGSVHGLTTAAAVWATSAVGVACGYGLWEIALVGSVLTVIALRLLLPVAVRIGGRWRKRQTEAR